MSTYEASPPRDPSAPPAIRCACGAVALQLGAAPLFAMLCHCTICQRFNDSDYADFLVYRRRDVTGITDAPIEYSRLRPPPNVDRGKCARCGTPVLERFRVPGLGDWAMIPRAVHGDAARSHPPGGHLFYHRRVRDIDDELPKYTGYWRSEFAFLRQLAITAFRSR
jgi:hypothetical protein